MSRVDRNLPSMPVPEFAFPDRHDGRVFVRHIGQNGKVSKRTIGYMTDSTRGRSRTGTSATSILSFIPRHTLKGRCRLMK